MTDERKENLRKFFEAVDAVCLECSDCEDKNGMDICDSCPVRLTADQRRAQLAEAEVVELGYLFSVTQTQTIFVRVLAKSLAEAEAKIEGHHEDCDTDDYFLDAPTVTNIIYINQIVGLEEVDSDAR